jgi:hypothetical protein
MKMITVNLDGVSHTELPEHLLDGPHISTTEDEKERTVVTIYRYQGKVVHRSVTVTLKKGLGIEGILGRLG